MKNKSQLFRHLNIPLKSIFHEEFNGVFRFSIHSAKLKLLHKTFISSSKNLTYFVCFSSRVHSFSSQLQGEKWMTSFMFIKENMRKPRLRHSRTVLGMIPSKKTKENPKIHRRFQQQNSFSLKFLMVSCIHINELLPQLNKYLYQ